MALIDPSDLAAVQAIVELNTTNPFSLRRIELERIALGSQFEPENQPFWSLTDARTMSRRANLVRLTDKARGILGALREKLLSGQKADRHQIQLYQDLSNYILFYELLDAWGQPADPARLAERPTAEIWKLFSAKYDYWVCVPGCPGISPSEKSHLFSVFNQIYRAFFNIYRCVIGESLPAATLRSRIWESIFTVDMQRYRTSLYRSLPQVTTLVIGPSGSGKELVARAIGLSSYIPFDPNSGQFKAEFTECYSAINISAFSSNLVESELFGHAKGAYTGAVSARSGWLETCEKFGSILLDEIGELELTTQVKLLRVLQNREFQRIGESKTRRFEGKLIAATNRDLRAEIEQKRFREDLYYRLCADVIETPSLHAQVQDNPEVLESLVGFITQRIAPDIQAELTKEVVQWLDKHLPAGYPWPGNIRELEQCVRNLMIHGDYRVDSRAIAKVAEPTLDDPRTTSEEVCKLVEQISSLELTADELISAYCQIAYRQTHSFEQAAKRLQLDRRTVRKRVWK
jgi:transcriptional regulator with AAA-type ATPase domain